MRDFDFFPEEINVFAGDTVEWFWTGQIPHTVTTDATNGPDSFDSGLLGNGAVYRQVITEAGEHPYYCIPHGAPGRVGMAGALRAFERPTEACDEDGLVTIRLSFEAVAAGESGFGVRVGETTVHTGAYAANRTTAEFHYPGTGEAVTFTVYDLDLPACSLALDLTLLSCSDPGTCDRALTADVGNCTADGRRPVTLAVSGLPATPAEYRLLLDGTEAEASPLTLSGTDSVYTILLPALGQEVLVELLGSGADTCSASTIVDVADCGLDCAILDLAVVTGNRRHNIEVRDFDFLPSELEVRPGDTVTFVWTGQVPHTATSDAIAGPDSWASELFGFGAEFTTVIETAGDHPYYCVPHGGPGGIGMAGVIRAVPECDTAGNYRVQIGFGVFGGSPAGYRVFLDGALVQDSVAYDDANGRNEHFVTLPGQEDVLHRITIQDREDAICAATVEVVGEDCSPPAPCTIEDLRLELAAPGVVRVDVRDFDFFPRDVSIQLGDTVRFVWTGQIPHTATSDAPSGPNSWDSGLLGEGATYDLVLDSTGLFPYYCIPHGGPGGIGMAGSIRVTEDCGEDNTRTVTGSFRAAGERGTSYRIVAGGDTLADPVAYEQGALQAFTVVLPAGDSAVRVIVFDTENPGCRDTFSIVVPACAETCADVMPAFGVSGEGEGLVITFTDSTSGPATDWLWGFGDGRISREQSPVHEYDESGTYEVCLLVQNQELSCNAVYCELVTVGPNSVGERRRPLGLLRLSPNPVDAAQGLNVAVDGLPPGPITDHQLSIIGSDGRLHGGTLSGGPAGWRVTAARLPAGLYVLRLLGNDGYYVGKLVVK